MKAKMSESAHYNNKKDLLTRPPNLFLNMIMPAALIILALCTSIMSGVLVSGSDSLTLSSIWEGIPYASGILIILGAHALGHYVQARLSTVKVYFPYFIPALGFVGTVGAYTKFQWPISERKVLIKIFASGPICGFFAAWIILIVGLFFSKVVDSTSVGNSVKMGDSIIMHITSFAILGKLPATKDVMLHPIAYAGWLGLFYNFCHLLPIGRFDGGRLTYALWGYRVTLWVSFITIGALLVLGYFSLDGSIWLGIAIVGAISTIGLRGQYPGEQYEQPLPKKIFTVLGITVIIFIISFTSIPLPIINR